MTTQNETSNQTPPDLIAALSNGDLRLSGLERRLAELVLQDMTYVTHASITEIATRAGVSAPTVTRFCRRMGCTSFSDFKVQLARSAYVGLRYLRPESVTATPAEVAEDVVTKAQNALFQMHRGLNLAAMERAAGLIAEAQMVHAFGSGGNSSLLVNEVQNRLFRLGVRISASNAQGMNLMISAAADPGTVVLGASLTGQNPELVRCLQHLRERGIPTIAMTQSNTPVAQAADVVIAVDLPEGHNIYRASSIRYGFLATVDILANLVAYIDKPRAMRILRGIEAQQIRHRNGDDIPIIAD